MDTRTPNTTPAADLVRFYLTAMLAAFGLPECAEQLRAATLAWATAAEILRLYLSQALPHEVGEAQALYDAACHMAAGRVDAAVARLSDRTGGTPAEWLAANEAARNAPTCERCTLAIPMVEPGPVGEAFALANGALRSGESWCCADCVATYPALAPVYAGPVSAAAPAATRAA